MSYLTVIRSHDRKVAINYYYRLGEKKRKKDRWKELEMWANAQRDGSPAEYRWRPLFNAAKFG